METRLIKEFLDLSTSLNYSSTARDLHISQSTLSKHIAAMEKELDARLFVRDSHSVRLTSAGRVFANRAAIIMREYEDALKALDDVKSSIQSTLSVGYILASPVRLVSEACRLFKQSNPEVRLSVYSMEPEEIVEAARNGEIDMGITMILTDAVPADMVFNELERERFGVLVDDCHQLARKQSVSMEDLAGERLLVPNPVAFPLISTVTSSRVREKLPLARIVEETSSLGGIGPLISANGYIALTYGCILRFFTEGYSFIPLDDFDITAAIGPLWKDSRENPNILRFVSCLNKAANQ